MEGGSSSWGLRRPQSASHARRVNACASTWCSRRPCGWGRGVCALARTPQRLHGRGCEGRAQVSARAAPCDPVRHGVTSSWGGCGGGSALLRAGPAAAHGQPGPPGAARERRVGRGRGRGGEETAGREGREGEAKKGEGKSRSREGRKRKRGGREAGAAESEGDSGAGGRGGSQGRPGGGRRGRWKRGGRGERVREGR